MFSISMLNSIRANASDDYKNHIPVATQTNLSEIGSYLESYDLLYNEFHVALFNKIGKTIIEQALCKNRLERFKAGQVKPLDVEEIYIDLAKSASAFDPDGKNPLGRREDDNVKAVFHRLNRQDCYDISLGDLDFARVFRSEATLDAFISGKLNSVYSRAVYDEWLIMKNTFATYDGYKQYQVAPITDETTATATKNFVKTLRKAVMDVGFDSRAYNKAGVMTSTPPEKLVLLVHKDIVAEVDVEVLAKVFNMGKTNIQVDIIPMDDFGTRTDCYGLLVDESLYRVYDTLSKMEGQRNAQGLFTNYFYHVHQIHSVSPFKNAIEFTTAEVA